MDRLELTSVSPPLPIGDWAQVLGLALSLFLLPGASHALDPEAALTGFRARAWTSDDGLPQDHVHAILQTSDGYLWVGTQEGLARFDGRTFRVFSRRNTPALKSNNIRALYEDRAGALWIGTAGGGLSRYAGGAFTTLGRDDGLYGGSALAVREDRDRQLWVGNWDGALRRQGRGFVRYDTSSGLPHWNVHAIALGADGRLWFATGGGVGLWENGRFHGYTTADGLSDNVVRTVYVDRHRTLWAGTDGGLDRFDGVRFVHASGRIGVRALCEDRDGNLWVGTTAGLTRVQAGALGTAFVRGLPADTVTALYEDREGTLWAGSEGSGLIQITDELFGSLRAADGLGSDHVKSVHEGPDGSLWIATVGGGVSRLRNGRFTTYGTAAGLPSDSVWAIWADHRNRVFALAGGRVAVLTDGQFRPWPLWLMATATSGAFYEDADGRMWLGAYGSLFREDRGRFVSVPVEGQREDSLYLSLLQTHDGSLWAGELRGLVRLRGGASRRFTRADGLADVVVLALHEDAAGTLWVGTGGGGLCRFQEERFRCFRSEDGLPSDNIYQILEDDREALWMSSSRGVFRVAKADLEAYAEGRVHMISSALYGVDDGLPSSTCEGESQPAGWKTADGRLWFPTTKGLAFVDPARRDRLRNREPPPVVIQGLLVDGQPLSVNEAASVTLPAGSGRVAFHFAGLTFNGLDRVRYRYKLEGFDGDWVDAERQRSAEYTRLPPGRYTFHVTACNKDGVWNPAGAAIAVLALPHFYERRGFVGFVVMALLGVGVAIHGLRMRLARRQFGAILSERLRLARELHDNLEQELAALGIQVLILRQAPSLGDDAQRPLGAISSILERCGAAVRAAVWDLRSGHDLVGALRQVATRLSAGRPVAVSVDVRGTPHSLGETVERQLLRIGQEAVTNAVRHGSPQNIHISLEIEPGRVRLSVRDDGCGFDPASTREGHFGLVGMRERVQDLKGSLSIRSRAGEGTEVTVDVALG